MEVERASIVEEEITVICLSFCQQLRPGIKCPATDQSDSALITPSNATNAIAFAGKALRKHGRKPLQ